MKDRCSMTNLAFTEQKCRTVSNSYNCLGPFIPTASPLPARHPYNMLAAYRSSAYVERLHPPSKQGQIAHTLSEQRFIDPSNLSAQ